MAQNDVVALVTSGLDQGITIPKTILEAAYKEVDTVLTQIDKTGKLDAGFKKLSKLRREGQVKGLQLAKLLFGMGERAIALGMQSDFEERLLTENGLSRDTVRRYITTWQEIHSPERRIPDRFVAQIATRPMKDQIRIAQTAKEMGKLRVPEMWKIIAAPDYSSLKKATNEILGRAERSNGMTIELNADGSLVVWGGGKTVQLAFINMQNTMDDPDQIELRARAIERIVRAAGIMDKRSVTNASA